MRLSAALGAVACLASSVLAMATPEKTTVNISSPPQIASEGIVYKISADRHALTASAVNGSFVNVQIRPQADTSEKVVVGFLFNEKGSMGKAYPLHLTNHHHHYSARSVSVTSRVGCVFFHSCKRDYTEYKVFSCNLFTGDFDQPICAYRCWFLGPSDQCQFE